ncbi:hypothetical protein Afer_0898 [Acidimicrobium ferrooxidans DSM 10331]|uniref:Uncharacterized protein n=1 Tax=Acidimicrobium ferrooxidans (strain DSM 10331 / JCM 15462 / NBRC 103882 / ICP) TaxID=525909 RepID=C7LYN5_ACIFD|nr:hypothetical protein Afer_0898 [Acidimicrobium ferrooxidans DSM 10331]
MLQSTCRLRRRSRRDGSPLPTAALGDTRVAVALRSPVAVEGGHGAVRRRGHLGDPGAHVEHLIPGQPLENLPRVVLRASWVLAPACASSSRSSPSEWSRLGGRPQASVASGRSVRSAPRGRRGPVSQPSGWVGCPSACGRPSCRRPGSPSLGSSVEGAVGDGQCHGGSRAGWSVSGSIRGCVHVLGALDCEACFGNPDTHTISCERAACQRGRWLEQSQLPWVLSCHDPLLRPRVGRPPSRWR